MIVEAIDAHTLEADSAWWTIYDESFPLEEREPREVILGSLRDGVGMALRAQKDDRTVALSTVHLLKDPAAVFLVYLGVEKAGRGRGVGAEVLERTWEQATARLSRGLGMIWEVDMPSRATAPAELEKRQKRIRFFERMGGRLLDRPYAQPPLHNDAPVPMHLMARTGAALDGATTERLVRAIYLEKYGAANGIDRAVLLALLEKTP